MVVPVVELMTLNLAWASAVGRRYTLLLSSRSTGNSKGFAVSSSIRVDISDTGIFSMIYIRGLYKGVGQINYASRNADWLDSPRDPWTETTRAVDIPFLV